MNPFLLRIVIFACLVFPQPILHAANSSKPNLLFILVDDQRWDALSCAGHPFLKTPHTDRLAREGAYFQNSFCVLPLCSPNRAAILTGQYPHVNGVIKNGNYDKLSHTLVTFPMHLQKAGYETAFIGKWHMGRDATPRPGFDYWVCMPGQGAYENPDLYLDGQLQKVQGYMTDILNQKAVEFIQKPHSKPFLIYLSHKAVHGPYHPEPKYQNAFKDQKILPPPSATDTLKGKPAIAAAPKSKDKMSIYSDELVRDQLRCQMSVEDGVGKILKALEETGQLDHTMIVYTSDNGYLWDEHGLADKRAAYEESIRVPLLIRYPPLIPAGIRVKNMALSIDVGPTFLDLAGVGIPSEMQGKSLLPLFQKEPANWRTSAFFEFYYENQATHIPTWQAIRTDKWKYITYPEMKDAEEMYNLESDPYEMKNLIHDEASQKTLLELKEQFQELLKETAKGE